MAPTTHAAAPLLGDEEQLYRTHARKLRSVVRIQVNTSDDIVEDACAFAWLQLVRCQPRRDTVFGWLRTVAIRAAVRLDRVARADAPIQTSELEHQSLSDLRHDPQTTDEVIDALDALRALHHRQRIALGLQALGFHYREIGELTGDTLLTVARHMRRARRAVLLARDGDGSS